MKLNPVELAVGTVVVGVWFYFLGWLTIPGALLGSLLWSLGGADGYSKAWRRIGVPAIMCLFSALWLKSFWPLISFLPFFGVLTIGYGIPSWNGPNGSQDDEGSFLGRLCYKLVGGKEWYDPESDQAATILLRGFLALLIGLTLLPFAWFNFGMWLLGLVLIVIFVPACEFIKNE